MSAKHTPGPWHRNIKPASKYPTVWSGRNTHVAYVVAGAPRGSGSGETMSDEEVEANIDLIAAAPEMLAFLKQFVEGFDENTEEVRHVAFIDTARQALALIAKAEGRIPDIQIKGDA